MTQFFKKFPVINYGNVPAINLLSRVNMSKLALTNKQAFYDYVVENNERLDVISYNYYEDSDYGWLINLSNNIIDPYYDFPLTDEDLNKFIAKKYGDIATAQQKIVFFRTNGLGNESTITTAAYAALGIGQQKYWSPQLDNNNYIMEYARNQEQLIVTTNKVIGLQLTNISGTFVDGELIKIGGNIVAELSYNSNGYATIRHVESSINPGDTIQGATSGATADVSSATVIAQNIPDNELVYWNPINAYDHEIELNQQRKNLKLLNKKFSGEATRQLNNLFI